jgi:hypothetical protein
MFRSLSAVTLLTLSALAAFPAEAGGDRRHDRRFSDHRQAFHGGLLLGERVNWRNRGIRFDNAYRNRNRKERMPFLKQFSSPATNRFARNNLIVVVPQAQGGGGGTYAGSSYVYQADGGTYVGGDGYGFYPTARPEQLAPKAKVIDIAVQDDPCAYEANVCVIRP